MDNQQPDQDQQTDNQLVSQPDQKKKQKHIQLSRNQIIFAVFALAVLLGIAVAAYFMYLNGLNASDESLSISRDKTEEAKESEQAPKKEDNIHESEKLGLSFLVPDGWSVSESSNSISVTSSDYKKDTTSEADGTNPKSGAKIDINLYENDDNETLDELVERDPGAADYSKQPKNDPGSNSDVYPLKPITELQVGGEDARQYLWAYEGSWLQTVVINGDNFLHFNLDMATEKNAKDESIDDFSKYRDTYDNLLESVKFL